MSWGKGFCRKAIGCSSAHRNPDRKGGGGAYEEAICKTEAQAFV